MQGSLLGGTFEFLHWGGFFAHHVTLVGCCLQADTNSRLQAAQRERDFLKQLNDTLLANQKDYQARLASVQVQ